MGLGLAFVAAGSLHAESNHSANRHGSAVVARVEFRVAIAHFVGLRIAPSSQNAPATLAALEKLRDRGEPALRRELAMAAAIRIDDVWVSANRGQVLLSTQHRDLGKSGGATGAAVHDTTVPPQTALLRTSIRVDTGGVALASESVAPYPNRATHVTRHASTWLHSYARAPGFMRAGGHEAASAAPATQPTYIAAIP